jgi:hypothetical protein
MSIKAINTRIKNKVDFLESWNSANITLLDGEIAIVRVATGEEVLNPITNEAEPVVVLLMKVGDGSTAFGNLPWMSAKASDVYNWAKTPEAEDIDVMVVTGQDADNKNIIVKKTLGTWLAEVYTKSITNTTAVENLNTAVDNINKTLTDDTTNESSVASKIKAAIDDLTYTDVAEDNQFVTVVEQTNGVINVTRRKLNLADIPSLPTSKITTGEDVLKTLDDKLIDIDSKFENLSSSILSDLSVTAEQFTTDTTPENTQVNFVTQVTQNNGKIDVKTRNIQLADLPSISEGKISNDAITEAKIKNKAVTKDKIADGAISNEKIEKVLANKVEVTAASGNVAAETLTDRLVSIGIDIDNIKGAILGGTHFRGTVNDRPSDIRKISRSGADDFIAEPGDIVLYGEKEFICSAIDVNKASTASGSATWIELGDLTRVGTLETLLSELACRKEDSKFVTHIENAAGTLKVKTDNIKASDVLFGSENVDVALNAQSVVLSRHDEALSNIGDCDTVGEFVTGELNKALDALASTGSDFGSIENEDAADIDSTPFVIRVDQDRGIVSSSSKKFPKASTSKYGAVKLNDTTSSSSVTEAATARAVKDVNDRATSALSILEALSQCTPRIAPNSEGVSCLYDGITEDVLIFDCGSAESLLNSYSYSDGNIEQ